MPNENDSAILRDSRDNQEYTVAKVNDTYWMTKNLNLSGGRTLTSSDSNVTSNYSLPSSSTTGFSDNNTAYVYNSGSTTCSSTSPCYSYYSFMAATAGTGGTSKTSGDVSQGICPKGWRLPTLTEVSTFRTNTNNTVMTNIWLAVKAGEYYNSNFRNGGSNGYWWSSTVSDASRAYSMDFGVGGGTYVSSGKPYGHSIRCIANI